MESTRLNKREAIVIMGPTASGKSALALALGIFITAVFPVGCLMFLVAFLLIGCGIACLKRR